MNALKMVARMCLSWNMWLSRFYCQYFIDMYTPNVHMAMSPRAWLSYALIHKTIASCSTGLLLAVPLFT